ncbi:MAG: hypothetical protein AAF719_01800 [Pseudomonadota bacterium]
MVWKIIGGLLMGVGGLVAGFMTLLAIVLITVYLEWENAADALRTVFFLTVPAALVGTLIALGGRWVMKLGAR